MNSASHIIKVVNLKRFMPDNSVHTHQTHAWHWPERIPKPKRHCSSVRNPESNHKIQTTKTVGNYSEDKRHAEKDIVEQKPVISKIQDTSFCQDNQMISRSKIKFRYCSHSLEELGTLHEHVDKTLVKLGDTFESRDSLRQHLNDNARKWHYYYVCRSSKSKVLEYNCICMAYSNNKKRDAVIRKQKKRTTACPCKLRLTIDEVTNKIVVYYVCNHHDHPTTASAFSQYPHAKYLPQHVKEEFLDLTYAGLDVILIQKYILSVIGLKIKKKDIWSYSYRFRKRIDTRTFSENRLKYLENLIKRIRETFGDSTDPYLTEDDKPSNTMISSIPKNELDTHPNEDSFYKGIGEHSLGIDTEVIVQYINEEGLLCDQNGLVANSTDIMQVMNNIVPGTDKYKVADDLSESAEVREEMYDLDWESVSNKSLRESYEKMSNVDVSHTYLNDTVDDELSMKERPAKNIVIISDCVYKNGLPLASENAGVYAEIENFNKYYYIDHRYITYEDQKKEKWNAIRQDGEIRHSATNVSSDDIREEYIKAPSFSYASIRYCSGHEHLELLSDPDAILAGAAFLNHESFLSYVNKRANRWFFYYSLAESGKSPENYAYKCVYGKHRMSKNAYRAKGLRKRNNLKTDCPCLIRLRRLESAPDYLTVLYSCNHHDHPRDEHQFNSQVHSRRLPPHVKEEIKDLVAVGVSSDVLWKYVFDETGLMISKKYFYNLWAGMRRRNEERRFSEERVEFLNEKVKELGAKYGDDQSKNRNEPLQSQDEMGDYFTPAVVDETGSQIEEYCDLTDFAEEVCIGQSDTVPAETTAKQSRLETRLQNLSHNDILMRVKKLQESVRCEGLRNHEVILD